MQINSRSRQILKKGSAKIDPNKRVNEGKYSKNRKYCSPFLGRNIFKISKKESQLSKTQEKPQKS